ncbi:hypothetical protein BAUCODRAFT_151710 [Baudoinia panamericana UAMH 10762]|uniref:SH3 domain-containing protein n=1 Tax=Baudoinia panamericana (strain UAMH 10762) TaxID=717646 RepID=M2M7J7_BAUPA|nr:uncharacterized protein BAUCODRAFT_151710 [Baudoinia panamericana UAMH 10762]EMC92296.1 hypothetical protein BAUCODRAFT_151710 [Baudoinia panamericana UAMH 10762]
MAQRAHEGTPREETLSETMEVWNLALWARMRRQPEALKPTAALDWSCMPSSTTFTALLHEPQHQHLDFAQVLELLLPSVRAWLKADSARLLTRDYASSAYITLDVLRKAQPNPNYAPLLAFLETAFTRHRGAGVPMQLQKHMDELQIHLDSASGVQLLQQYEAVIRNFGMIYKPATTRAQPSPDPEAKESNVLNDVNETLPETAQQIVSNATKDNQNHDFFEAMGSNANAVGQDLRSPPTVRMLYNYEAPDTGVLSVTEGTEVSIVEPDAGDGWVLVKLLQSRSDVEASRSEIWVPASYLQMTDSSPEHVNADAPRPGAGEDTKTSLHLHTSPTADASHLTATAASTVELQSDTQSATLSLPSLPESSDTSEDWRDAATNRFVNLRMDRLNTAIAKLQLGLAEHIKEEVLEYARNPNRAAAGLPNKLYERLMLALLTLHSAGSAIEVWNHLVGDLKRQPTTRTFTVMMQGAQQVRDVNGMERFWQKMRDAGVQPDTYAWSTRIHGLIRGGKLDQGLMALTECGNDWLSAARTSKNTEVATGSRHGGRQKTPTQAPEPRIDDLAKLEGEINGVPKPDIIVMNSAISGLAVGADRLIPKVLSWGRKFGIQPDLVTYNALLGVSMRNGMIDEALSILMRMQERGMATDGTTWTVMLDSMLREQTLHDLTHEEQERRVMGFITALDAISESSSDSSGPSALNEKSYALVIDRLLKWYKNSSAANAVLAHMMDKGLKPTPHIYTVLMTHHFQREPQPDFEAAESLWRHIQAAEAGRGLAVDDVLYDRMIEGYAQHHQAVGIQPVLHFLDRMKNQHRRPSWRAMECAARALAERGMWDRLTRLVADAKQELQEGSESQLLVGKRNYGQASFWQYVIDLGLLRDESVRSSLEVMRRKTGYSPMERRLRNAA